MFKAPQHPFKKIYLLPIVFFLLYLVDYSTLYAATLEDDPRDIVNFNNYGRFSLSDLLSLSPKNIEVRKTASNRPIAVAMAKGGDPRSNPLVVVYSTQANEGFGIEFFQYNPPGPLVRQRLINEDDMLPDPVLEYCYYDPFDPDPEAEPICYPYKDLYCESAWDPPTQYELIPNTANGSYGAGMDVSINNQGIIILSYWSDDGRLYVLAGHKNIIKQSEDPCVSPIRWFAHKAVAPTSASNPNGVSVAINNNNEIVLFYVHERNFYYRVGEVKFEGLADDGTPNGYLNIGERVEYDAGSGSAVSVDMNDHGQVIEVHHGAHLLENRLYVNLGVLRSEQERIDWVRKDGSAKSIGTHYANGDKPFVSINNQGQFIEGREYQDKIYLHAGYWRLQQSYEMSENDIKNLFGGSQVMDATNTPYPNYLQRTIALTDAGVFLVPQIENNSWAGSSVNHRYQYYLGHWHRNPPDAPSTSPALHGQIEQLKRTSPPGCGINNPCLYNTVSVNWDRQSFLQRQDVLTHFSVYRDGALVKELGPFDTHYEESLLSMSEQHTYKVQASFNQDAPVTSQPLTVKTNYLSLNLKEKTKNTVSLEWSLNLDQGLQTEFVVFRNGVPLEKLQPDTHQFTDSNVDLEENYEYVIEAKFPGYSLKSTTMKVSFANYSDEFKGVEGRMLSPIDIELRWPINYPADPSVSYAIYRSDNVFSASEPFKLLEVRPEDYPLPDPNDTQNPDWFCPRDEPGFFCYRDRGEFVPGDGGWTVPTDPDPTIPHAYSNDIYGISSAKTLQVDNSAFANETPDPLDLQKMSPGYLVMKMVEGAGSLLSDIIECNLERGECIPLNQPQIVEITRPYFGHISIEIAWDRPEYMNPAFWHINVYRKIPSQGSGFTKIFEQEAQSDTVVFNYNDDSIFTEQALLYITVSNEVLGFESEPSNTLMCGGEGCLPYTVNNPYIEDILPMPLPDKGVFFNVGWGMPENFDSTDWRFNVYRKTIGETDFVKIWGLELNRDGRPYYFTHVFFPLHSEGYITVTNLSTGYESGPTNHFSCGSVDSEGWCSEFYELGPA